MVNLKNVAKVFVYLSASIAKTGVFLDDNFIYCNVRKLTVFFNSSVSNQMSLIASVNSSGVAGGKQRGRLASNNHY